MATPVRRLEPPRHRQPLPPQEIRVEQLGLIARAAVAEDGHDGVDKPQFPGEADGAGDVDAARTAEFACRVTAVEGGAAGFTKTGTSAVQRQLDSCYPRPHRDWDLGCSSIKYGPEIPSHQPHAWFQLLHLWHVYVTTLPEEASHDD